MLAHGKAGAKNVLNRCQQKAKFSLVDGVILSVHRAEVARVVRTAKARFVGTSDRRTYMPVKPALYGGAHSTRMPKARANRTPGSKAPAGALPATSGSPGKLAGGDKLQNTRVSRSRRGVNRAPRARLRGGDVPHGSSMPLPASGHAGRNRLRLLSRRRKVAGALMSLLLVLYQLAFPLSAVASAEAAGDTAQQDDVTFQVDKHTNTNPCFAFATDDGEISYCMEYELNTPKEGQKYAPSGNATGGLGYIALHGYNSTTVIEGQELPANEARWATQYAYWIYQGCLNTDCVLQHSSNLQKAGETLGFAKRDGMGWSAGVKLYQAAKAFEADATRNTPDAPENKAAQIFTRRLDSHDTDSKAYQPMVVVRPTNGKIDLQKDSTDPRTITPKDSKQGSEQTGENKQPYSLAGAWYSVWKDEACTQGTGTYLKTDANGTGKLYVWANGPTNDEATLPEGIYYVREKRAPEGYKLDNTVYRVQVWREATTFLTENCSSVHDAPFTRGIQLHKTMNGGKGLDGNRMYSLEGATYGVWNTREGAQNLEDAALANKNTDPLDGYWYIVHSGANNVYVLDADKNSGSVGLWRYSAADNQQWLISRNSDGTCTLKNRQRGTLLGSNDSSGKVDATDSGSRDTHWKIEPNEDGSYTISSKEALLASETGRVVEGTNVVTSKVSDEPCPAETWQLRRVSGFQGSMTTDQKGEAKLDNLPLGTYYVREVTPPSGCQTDPQIYEAQVKKGSDGQVKVADDVLWGNVDIVARKYDADIPLEPERVNRVFSVDASDDAAASAGAGNGVGSASADSGNNGGRANLPGASLAGAQFTLNYYDGNYDQVSSLPQKPSRHWVLKTDAGGACSIKNAYRDPESFFVSGDAFYLDGNGEPALPLGTYTIQETAPPEGYDLSDNTVYLKHITASRLSSGQMWVGGFSPVRVGDRGIRGDLSISKTDASSGAPLPGIAFLVTNNQTHEAHVIVTNQKGIASTAAAPHTQDTNKNDEAVTPPQSSADDPKVDQGKLSAAYGTWFFASRGSNAQICDRRGALPYGTYTVRELPSQANSGYSPLEPFTVDVRANHEVVSKSVTNTKAGIGTELTSELTDTHTASCEETRLKDTVSYQGLIPGKSYELRGSLHQQGSGEAIQVDGKPVEATATFVPQASSGEVVVEFPASGTALAGKSVTAFESLYLDNKEIATHADANDQKQTVCFASIGTTAREKQTNGHVAASGDADTLVDTVHYQGLIPHEKYRLTATLHVRQPDGTIADAQDASGKRIQVTKDFEPESSEGSVDVEVTLDTSKYAGSTVVFFETLEQEGTAIARHEDITDENQSVHVPAIGTTATVGGSHETLASGKLTINDEVGYRNLMPGESYQLVGTLMDAQSGKPILVNGKPVRSQQDIQPKEGSGTVSVPFDIADASTLAGKKVVVFEKLSQKGTDIARHEDLNDAAQAISFPSIATQVHQEGENNTNNEFCSTGEVKIIDTVAYANLAPEKEYVVSGTLVDAQTGNPTQVDGANITASTTFAPQSESGTCNVSFIVDARKIAGKRLVAFETLQRDGNTVAEHKDTSDEAQAVYVPGLATTLVDAQTSEHATTPSKQTQLVDTVEYAGVKPGVEHVVEGILYDKQTGKPVAGRDGKPVTASTSFTPNDSQGKVQIEFQLDTTELAGHDLVAFETLKRDEAALAQHHDLEDASQTVHVSEQPPSVPDEKPNQPTESKQDLPTKPASSNKGPAAKSPLPTTGEPGTDAAAGMAAVGAVTAFATGLLLVKPKPHGPRKH